MIGRPLSPVSFAGARRRGRRRGLVAGAAIGAGVMHHQNKKAQEATDQEYEDTAPVPAPAAAPPAANDTVTQIQQLAQLKDQGILTEEEFAAKKAQLLGI